MKKTLSFLAVFALYLTLARAEVPDVALADNAAIHTFSLSTPLPATAGPGLNLAADFSPNSPADFAELNDTAKSTPLPPTWILAFGIAFVVMACRLYALKHARQMADYEREVRVAKARMFSSLQETSPSA